MEKVSLPIKTKVAAWWMIFFGGAGMFFGLAILNVIFTLFPFGAGYFPILISLLVMFCGILFLISGCSLLKRKKWAWWFSIVLSPILYLILISWAYDYWMRHYEPGFFLSLFSLIVNIFSLILLLLDRKNFWEIAA